MALVLLAARLVLAAVFAVAAVGKLADRRGSRQAMLDFGVPATLASGVGALLPVAELAVAVALVPRATAWWGALGALALLLAFIGGIGYNLAHGRTPDCHCFGQIHSEPAGWPTLARNGLLTALAALVLSRGPADPGASAVAWLGELTLVARVGLGVALVLVSALAAQSWLVVHLLRQNGRLLLRMEALEDRLSDPQAAAAASTDVAPEAGLVTGSEAPAFHLPGLYGETLTLQALTAMGNPTLLIFADPKCGPCNTLLPELGRYQREYPKQVTLALITRGTAEDNRSKAREHGLAHVLLQHDREVARAYHASGTPSAVLVRSDGTIGSPLAQGADQVRALMETLIAPPPSVLSRPRALPMLGVPTVRSQHGSGPLAPAAAPPASHVGEAAPPLTLPDLDGTTVSLGDLRGKRTLVLFWNPSCGFCQRMLDDLKAWEAHPPDEAPKLLVISSGSAEATRAQGFRAQVLLDDGFSAGRAFGVGGTPTGVLLDKHGTIASAPAVGAQEVEAMLGVARAHA